MGCLFHKWDGCKCSKCGKTRDEGHAYEKIAGQCKEKCSRCGMERDAHDWDGCTCRLCGATRDESHTFGEDGFCVKCGAPEPEPYRIDYLTEPEKSILIESVKATGQLMAQRNQPQLVGAMQKIQGHLEAKGVAKLDVFDVTVLLESVIPNLSKSLRESGGEQNEKGAALLESAGVKLGAHRAEVDAKIAARKAAQ